MDAAARRQRGWCFHRLILPCRYSTRVRHGFGSTYRAPAFHDNPAPGHVAIRLSQIRACGGGEVLGTPVETIFAC
jgi:hypothetical protein